MSSRRRWPPESVETGRSACSVEVEGLEQLVGAARGLLPGHAVGAGLADQLVAAALRCGRRRCPGRRTRCCRRTSRWWRDHVVTGDLGRPGRRRDQGGQHPQGGRLAGAVGAEEGDELAAVDLEVEAADGLDRLLVAGEVPGQPAGPDHRGFGVFVMPGNARKYSGQLPVRNRNSLLHEHERPHAAAAVAAADPPLLARRGALRAPRRQRPHAAPRHRPAARARATTWTPPEGSPAATSCGPEGRCRRCCSRTRRRSRSRSGCAPRPPARSSGMEETSVQALTKVIALMPPRLRRRMDAVHLADRHPASGVADR